MTSDKTGTTKFQKPFVPNYTLLNNKVGDPSGYVTKDGMWAAVPYGKQFIIIHNGRQVHIVNTYKQALAYIKKSSKITKSKSSLEEFL
mgnify:CR=1 FL=1|tara:strand:- start:4547 stop:4810 length:264 start_codon:yes stop_codon:yes gene_type:complete